MLAATFASRGHPSTASIVLLFFPPIYMGKNFCFRDYSLGTKGEAKKKNKNHLSGDVSVSLSCEHETARGALKVIFHTLHLLSELHSIKSDKKGEKWNELLGPLAMFSVLLVSCSFSVTAMKVEISTGFLFHATSNGLAETREKIS